MNITLVPLRPIERTDGYGSTAWEYEPCTPIWAELDRESARRRIEVGEQFAYHGAEYRVRLETPVQELWRVKHGNILYSVAAVIENRDRGMKTLICERVNE